MRDEARQLSSPSLHRHEGDVLGERLHPAVCDARLLGDEHPLPLLQPDRGDRLQPPVRRLQKISHSDALRVLRLTAGSRLFAVLHMSLRSAHQFVQRQNLRLRRFSLPSPRHRHDSQPHGLDLQALLPTAHGKVPSALSGGEQQVEVSRAQSPLPFLHRRTPPPRRLLHLQDDGQESRQRGHRQHRRPYLGHVHRKVQGGRPDGLFRLIHAEEQRYGGAGKERSQLSRLRQIAEHASRPRMRPMRSHS